MPPEPRYGFSGRSRELLEIERALLQSRLVVIRGFGGMGKTALAREAADWFTRTGFYQRACFVSFEQGGDAALLLGTLGRFLGIYDGFYNPNDLPAAMPRIQQALRKQRVLVLTDNLESILPGGEAPLAAELRRQLWSTLLALRKLGAGVLLTTRDIEFGEGRLAPGKEVLHLRLAGLAAEDAYLFASQVLTDLGIERARVPYSELRALLAQLEYHPLAIQLVLPALRQHAVAQIRTEFDRLLPIFVDDTAGGRNRSLLASLDYSLRQLGTEHRVLLGRLTIFEGGASEDDLLAITQIQEPEWASLRVALEQAALLEAEQVHPAIEVPFLHFHPVLLPFVRSQSGTEAETDLRQRYARRYSAVADYLDQLDFQHPEPVRALVRRELPNLRHALVLLLEEGQLEEASDLAYSLARFLTIFGRLREREQWREHLAQAMAEQRAQADGTLSQVEYLHELGLAEDEQGRGQVQAALARLSSLLPRIQAQPDGTDVGPGSFAHARTLHVLGYCLVVAGQLTAAEERLREALAVVEQLLEQEPEEHYLLRTQAHLFGDLGTALTQQGKYPQAKAAYEQALKGDTTLRDSRNAAVTLQRLGALARVQGEYGEARTRLLQAQEQFEALGEPAAQADIWYNLGLVAEEMRDWSEAERYLRESLALRERLGDLVNAAASYNVLALVAQRTGRPEEAEGWYRGALARIERVEPDGIRHAGYLNNLAALLVSEVQAGRVPKTRLVEARRYAEQSLQIDEQPGVAAQVWITFNILAQIAQLEGDQQTASAYWRRERESYAAFASNRERIDRQQGALIAAIARAAQGDQEQRAAVEARLPRLEQAGWRIAAAVEQIWAGERDWHTLGENLERGSALLLLRVLESLEQPSGAPSTKAASKAGEEELLASFPQALRQVLARGDAAAFKGAIEALSPEEQQHVAAMLEALQHEEQAVAGEAQEDAEAALLAQVDPLLQAIAFIAAGGEVAQRHEIEQVLTGLEAQEWHLQGAVERLWAGERDAGVLSEGLDAQDRVLITRVLELLTRREASPSKDG
jgi:tetratricopeptide (TPR) repeat protein